MGWEVNVTSPPGKKPVTAPRPVWRSAEKLTPTGILSPDPSARGESLYRLNYPGLFGFKIFIIIIRSYSCSFFFLLLLETSETCCLQNISLCVNVIRLSTGCEEMSTSLRQPVTSLKYILPLTLSLLMYIYMELLVKSEI
jgi:hypothetical protein